MNTQPRFSSRSLGIAQILLSGFCFGFLGLFGKAAFAKGATPGELLSLRFTLAGVLLLSFLAIRSRNRLRLPRTKIIWSVILGIFGYAVFSFFYFQALKGLSVSLTVLLLYTYPISVAAGAWIFLGEKIPRNRLFVIPMATLGLAGLVWGDFYVTNALALGFGIASAVFYSAYILFSRKYLEGVDVLPSAGIMQLAAGLTLGVFNWRDPAHVFELISEIWPLLLGLAFICSIAAMSLFLAGLQKLRSWEVSILSTSEPITSILIAFIFLDERLTHLQTLGGSLVLLAFIFVSLPSRMKERANG
jgi:drug/metabolite transporter (DMT)-like permease